MQWLISIRRWVEDGIRFFVLNIFEIIADKVFETTGLNRDMM